tara:strand:- start:514 stop:693 length:180 start_codon:yes stop_codon:yes gene_type:complete
MTTKRMAARMSHLNINKLDRYYHRPELRKLLEALIVLSEENQYVRNKLNKKLDLLGRKA